MIQWMDTLITPEEAKAQQRDLAKRVEREDRLGEVRFVAGIDMSGSDEEGAAQAAIVVLSYPDLVEVEVARHTEKPLMEYVPGFLSFREMPVILGAWEKLKQKPDLIMVDGHGIAHPRRLGIAAHLGVWLDWPTIGCAKSLFVGTHADLPDEVGAQVNLVHHGELIGVLLRTRRHANPMYISTGNRVSLPTAVSYVKACGRGYRLPETTRLAHIHAGERQAKDENSASG